MMAQLVARVFAAMQGGISGALHRFHKRGANRSGFVSNMTGLFSGRKEGGVP
jgi:hypothetical protein